MHPTTIRTAHDGVRHTFFIHLLSNVTVTCDELKRNSLIGKEWGDA